MVRVENSVMRFAIYYAPEPNSRLHQLGSHWLGFDAFSRQKIEQPEEAFLRGKTEGAMRYGLHATLKAPFYLRAGKTEMHVIQEARQLATLAVPVTVDSLIISEIDGFLALVPAQQSSYIDNLAASCVRHFDHLRLPPDASELARRHESGLTTLQSQYLAEWGYPYVFGEFRFHMTLTNKLRGEELSATKALAETYFAEITGKTLTIQSVSIFVEPVLGGQFHIVEQISLGNSIMAAFA